MSVLIFSVVVCYIGGQCGHKDPSEAASFPSVGDIIPQLAEVLVRQTNAAHGNVRARQVYLASESERAGESSQPNLEVFSDLFQQIWVPGKRTTRG